MTDPLTESQRKQIEAERRPGDPESGQPNPVRADTFYDELASERPVRASAASLALSAVLPGAGHFLVGAPIGPISAFTQPRASLRLVRKSRVEWTVGLGSVGGRF